MPATRVSYVDEPAIALNVRLIHEWHRGDISEPVMSASSGPKAYVKNDVYALFESNAAIDAVLMVRANGPPFFLLRRGRTFLDMSNRAVDIESVEDLCRSSS